MSSSSSTIDGDLIVRGTVRAGNFQVPDNSVGDSQFNSADPLTAIKQEHQFNRLYEQARGASVAAKRTAFHLAIAEGQFLDVRAGVTQACIGDSTITVDIYKNGTTILSSTISLSSSQAAYDQVVGTISSMDYAAADVFEVVVTVAAGTGTLGQGLFVHGVFREGAG